MHPHQSKTRCSCSSLRRLSVRVAVVEIGSGSRKWRSPSLFLLYALCAAPLVFAGPVATYHSAKEFTADIGNAAGVGTGHYRYLTHAMGADKHNIDHNDQPDRTGALFPTPKAATQLTTGLRQSGGFIRDFHKWTFLVPFDQAGGDIQSFGPFSSTATTPHTMSNASVKLDSLGLSDIELGFGLIVLDGKAEITNWPPPANHAPESAYAEAQSAGEMTIVGKILRASVSEGKKFVRIILNVGQTALRSIGGARALAPSTSPPLVINRDPLSLSFFDAVTGNQIASETLFSDDWITEGTASITFDPSAGLSLVADIESRASMTFSTLSSWVLNPFDGAVGIIDGIFSATGDLADLPWVVSTVGGQTIATLMPGDLDLDFNFMVEATGLGSPANDVLVVISADAQGFANAFASVPEPSTLVLVAIGTFGLLGTGWRRRKEERRNRVRFTFPLNPFRAVQISGGSRAGAAAQHVRALLQFRP